jgi:hypothetical protein
MMHPKDLKAFISWALKDPKALADGARSSKDLKKNGSAVDKPNSGPQGHQVNGSGTQGPSGTAGTEWTSWTIFIITG